jgi:CheY-like chemotaxis protein
MLLRNQDDCLTLLPITYSYSGEPVSLFCSPTSDAQFTPAKKTSVKQVLVIDDESSIADSLVLILKASGFDARAFYLGQSAIDFVRSHCPDVVLSDVMMPKMNGVDTVLAIREICPNTRILLFSGQAGTGNILQKARDRGHEFELLPKPLHPDELLRRLAGLWKT